jgi:hypothetical protein
LYGGLYDRLLGAYVAGAKPARGEVTEIPVHPGQLQVVLHPGNKRRVMAFGGPGSGKTRAITIWIVLQALTYPGKIFGNVGATADRKLRLWEAHGEIVPATWVERASENDGEIRWCNRSVHDFRAAKEPSAAVGTPIQGVSWWRAVIDETQNVSERAQHDINERGRNAGTEYMVLESATNVDYLPAFTRRRKEYETSPLKQVLRLDPLENPWVELAYWEQFKLENGGDLSDREFRKRILSEDVPLDRLVYAPFKYAAHLARMPRLREGAQDLHWEDITASTFRQWDDRRPRRIGAGLDFGRITTVSEFYKVWRARQSSLVVYWFFDEVTSGSYIGTEGHVRDVARRYDPEETIYFGDPHTNTPDTDRSDYTIARNAGLFIHKAGAPPIRPKHRIAMWNVLLEQGRILFDVDVHEKPRCERLIESMLSMEHDDHGNPEAVRKDKFDPTHWPAAAQYGLFPLERARGQYVLGADGLPKIMSNQTDKLTRRTT